MDKMILSFDAIKNRLTDMNAQGVARKTGILGETIRRIRRGDIEVVNSGTLEKLSDYFLEGEKS